MAAATAQTLRKDRARRGARSPERSVWAEGSNGRAAKPPGSQEKTRPMDLVSDMRLFLCIVASGSMAAGGREVGLSPASVTSRLKALEQRFEAPLFIRSTRSLQLTAEGKLFYDTARRVLDDVSDLEMSIGLNSKNVSGRLRVAAPVDLGCQHVRPLIDEFIVEKPSVRVDLILSDHHFDLVAQSIDVAFRYGAITNSDFIRHPLGGSQKVICASPSYLEAHGRPLHPRDLRHHNCMIHLRRNEPLDDWAFKIEGHVEKIRVSGDRASNHGRLLRRWALAGLGVMYGSIWDVEEDLDAGRLQQVLEAFRADDDGLSLVFPFSHRKSTRVRAFIEAALGYFRQDRGGPALSALADRCCRHP